MAIGLFLSLFIGISLGLLGGGGSILTVPILLYAMKVEVHQAIAISLFVVGITSSFGAWQHTRKGNVDFSMGLLFSIGAMVGAYAGGRLGSHIPGHILLILFTAMMLITAVAMLRKKENPNYEKRKGKTYLILLDGLLVGAFTGMVGAGGGFLVVPALVLIGGLPIKKAIGTSLMIISLKSFAGLFGYLSEVEINWNIALLVAAMAIIGTLFGTKMSHNIAPDKLRKGFAWFVLTMGLFILIKENIHYFS